MPYLPPSTLPGVSPSPSGGFVAAPMATKVPQTQAAAFTTSPVTAKLAPVLGTDRAARSDSATSSLSKNDMGMSTIGGSTLGQSSGGGGGGSAGSPPVGEDATDVPDVGGGGADESGEVDENGNDVSTALGMSIGAALRGSLVPLVIGAGAGLLVGFVLSR